MDARDKKGRFTKGNPGGGRPKGQPTIKELLQRLSPQAVTCLGALMQSDDEVIALNASIAILGFSLQYGKKRFTNDNDEIHALPNISRPNIDSSKSELKKVEDFFNQFGLNFHFVPVKGIEPIRPIKNTD